MAVCQLSLDPRSFYSHGITIQRSRLALRFVNVVEFMLLILRRDAFCKTLTLLPEPGNAWGLEYVVCKYFENQPRLIAILDAVSALHTRAHGTSAMYKHLKSGGKTMDEAEAEFLARHGAEKVKRVTRGAIDLLGTEVNDLRRLNRPVARARLTNIYWQMRKITRLSIPQPTAC